MVLNEHIQYRYTASSKERYIAVGIYVGSRFLSAPKIGKVITMLRYDYDISTYTHTGNCIPVPVLLELQK